MYLRDNSFPTLLSDSPFPLCPSLRGPASCQTLCTCRLGLSMARHHLHARCKALDNAGARCNALVFCGDALPFPCGGSLAFFCPKHIQAELALRQFQSRKKIGSIYCEDRRLVSASTHLLHPLTWLDFIPGTWRLTHRCSYKWRCKLHPLSLTGAGTSTHSSSPVRNVLVANVARPTPSRHRTPRPCAHQSWPQRRRSPPVRRALPALPLIQASITGHIPSCKSRDLRRWRPLFPHTRKARPHGTYRPRRAVQPCA